MNKANKRKSNITQLSSHVITLIHRLQSEYDLMGSIILDDTIGCILTSMTLRWCLFLNTLVFVWTSYWQTRRHATFALCQCSIYYMPLYGCQVYLVLQFNFRCVFWTSTHAILFIYYYRLKIWFWQRNLNSWLCHFWSKGLICLLKSSSPSMHANKVLTWLLICLFIERIELGKMFHPKTFRHERLALLASQRLFWIIYLCVKVFLTLE